MTLAHYFPIATCIKLKLKFLNQKLIKFNNIIQNKYSWETGRF